MSETIPQDSRLAALQLALGDPGPGRLLHHSDRSSQYAAYDCRKVLRARGITVFMSRKADCWDNAPMESLNGTLKVECVHGEHFQTREQAAQAIGCILSSRSHLAALPRSSPRDPTSTGLLSTTAQPGAADPCDMLAMLRLVRRTKFLTVLPPDEA